MEKITLLLMAVTATGSSGFITFENLTDFTETIINIITLTILIIFNKQKDDKP